MSDGPQDTKILRMHDRSDGLKELCSRLETESLVESATPADVAARRAVLWAAVLITDYSPGSQFALSVMADLVDPEYSYATCYRIAKDLQMSLATL